MSQKTLKRPAKGQQIANHTIFTGDNLYILRGIDSESIDLIYLDPPFNSNRHYSAPIGSQAAGAEFKDAWTFEDTKDAWWGLIADEHPALYKVIDAAGDVGNEGDKAYLIYMAMRLLEMHRILKPTGSIYLHCDTTMSHSLKMVMDAIFGRKNFRNEIVWRIGWVSGFKTQKRGWIRNHDVLLFFVKSPDAVKLFNKEFIPYPPEYRRRDGKKPTGKGIPIEDTWNCSENDRLDSIMIKSFSKEKVGYPTQKPLDLLRRIIKASSNEGDVVLDPFCGCATACIAAEDLGRQWIGIDISARAAELVQIRAAKELTDLFKGKSRLFEVVHRTDIPLRSEEVGKSQNIKHELYGHQEGRCNGCGHSFDFRNMEVDHIVPRSKGGPDTDKNLQLLCGHCNRVKGARDMPYLIARLREDGIIDPLKKRSHR